MDLQKTAEARNTFFERKIRPALLYVGFAGSIIMSIAYIITVVVLIFGFKADGKLESILAFAIANAIVGLIILFFMKVQGKSFAENLSDNQEIIKNYYGNKTKDKKIHSFRRYMVTSTIKDIFTKAATVIITTTAIIKIVIEGSGDMSLLGLGVVNLLMFICFGLLALVQAYDYYNNFHVPYMKEQLKSVGIELKKEPENDIIIDEESGEKSHD